MYKEVIKIVLGYLGFIGLFIAIVLLIGMLTINLLSEN